MAERSRKDTENFLGGIQHAIKTAEARPFGISAIDAIKQESTRLTLRHEREISDERAHRSEERARAIGLTDEQCDALWERIQGKKYVYGFGRDKSFIERCRRIQARLCDLKTLRRLAACGIYTSDVVEGHLMFMKRLFQGEKNGSTK